MKNKRIELDIDYMGSQDPADQPTAEDFAAISRYIQEQKQRRAVEAARQQEAHGQPDAPKEAA